MKTETLKAAQEIANQIELLENELFVIDHLKRDDMNHNPPSYNCMKGNGGRIVWYYVPKEKWIEFLNAERERISNKLESKKKEFEAI